MAVFAADQTWMNWATTSASNTTHTWDIWLDQGTQGTTTSTQVWNVWASTADSTPFHSVPLTEEQKAAQAERRRVQDEQYKLAREREAAAKEKSLELLRSALDRKQQEELDKDGFFHVETADGRRRYRLAPGRPPIRVHGEDGRRFSYCIHPDGHWPPGDVVLAQKLMLESDEQQFLRTANATPVTA